MKVPRGVIKISAGKFDLLYPKYEQAKKNDSCLTFQQWLRQQRGERK